MRQMLVDAIPVHRVNILLHVPGGEKIPTDVLGNRNSGGRFDERIGGRDERDHGGEMRRLQHRGEPLIYAFVGAAVGADFSVGPRLRGAPFDGVVAVLSVGAIGNERAVGIAAAANVFVDEDVAFGDVFANAVEGARPAAGFDVGRAADNRGKFAGRVGTIYVGRKFDAVAHFDADIELNFHGVSGLGGGSGILGDCARARRRSSARG